MTDIAATPSSGAISKEEAAARRARQRKKRFAAEARFKYLGLGAVLLAGCFLLLLLSTVVGQGLPAFTYHYAKLPVDLISVKSDEAAEGDYAGIFRSSVVEVFPSMTSRRDSRVARRLFSSGANIELRKEVVANPSLAGAKREVELPVSDFADLYLKGLTANTALIEGDATLQLREENGTVSGELSAPLFGVFLAGVKKVIGEQAEAVNLRISAEERGLAEQARRAGSSRNEAEVVEAQEAVATIRQRIDQLRADYNALISRQSATEAAEQLTSGLPSLLVYVNGGVIKATRASANAFEGTVLLPIDGATEISAGEWEAKSVESPEANRKFTDREIALIDQLDAKGFVEKRINWIFLSTGASREPELAGIWGAVIGSFYTMIVTLILSFPIGVAAAIYLEEFAPKNRLTALIEVNINNLAAVPSIVFGLLGLAVFLNWFNFPRSAPLVGGMVLALMTLPTIIIASRAALKAVPPSIREAAMGVGASRLQSVLHHVLPLAMPGMLTGTIIGMAQALGETAPLLMIGMVAFIVDLPSGITDPATVLPVQIFMWADFPEPAFQQKTAAAIMVLLVFLIMMNLAAILLRKRFERRW